MTTTMYGHFKLKPTARSTFNLLGRDIMDMYKSSQICKQKCIKFEISIRDKINALKTNKQATTGFVMS